MKLTKEELINKVNELELDDDKKIELMEDITDSIEIVEGSSVEVDELKGKIEELEMKNEDLKRRYKERFLNDNDGEQEEKEKIEEKEDVDEFVDVKEI